MDLILASSSPRRKAILEEYGYKFDIVVREVDETMSDDLSIIDNVLMVSKKKALAVTSLCENKVIISCDTIVTYEDKIYGKPKDEEDAFCILKNLSGHTHEVISGVCIIAEDKIHNFCISSKVKFKSLSDNDIYNYIETKECFGKAGSYAIQGIGSSLVEKYEGDLNNIIGLPIEDIKPIIDKYLGE